jgi:hypothetical protein
VRLATLEVRAKELCPLILIVRQMLSRTQTSDLLLDPVFPQYQRQEKSDELTDWICLGMQHMDDEAEQAETPAKPKA